MNISLILTCAGRGERAKFNKNKLLVKIAGKNVLSLTLSQFIKSGLINQYIITSSKEDFEEIKKLVSDETLVVIGGSTRTESVKNGLSVATGDIVLIHDGARPFVTQSMIKDCIETAINFGSAIPIIPTRDTLICESKKYLGKNGIFNVQSPQGFNLNQIKKAYSLINGESFNDDGEIYQRFIGSLNFYNGNTKNLKLTYPEDFYSLQSSPVCHIGSGFDCHRLTENRKLILGGIEIPYSKGLLGHSDADVLTHAIMDAILSACALRDIGYYFPDNNNLFLNANSITLLKKVLKMVNEKGYKVNNVSACIMAQKPKLLCYIPLIINNLSNILNLSETDIGISATTLEGLGFVGREEGICVSATATVVKLL